METVVITHGDGSVNPNAICQQEAFVAARRGKRLAQEYLCDRLENVEGSVARMVCERCGLGFNFDRTTGTDYPDAPGCQQSATEAES